MLRELLCGAGYEHYEISNFALPGRRARHNSLYWHGVPYLGIGPSAHSFDGKRRQWNISHLGQYLERTPTAEQTESETLTPDMQYDEYLMTHLRTSDGVHTAVLASRFGTERLHYFLQQAQRHLATGDLVCTSGPAEASSTPLKLTPGQELITGSTDALEELCSHTSTPAAAAKDRCYRIPAERWFISDGIISDLFAG